jgi:hypothetical protein
MKAASATLLAIERPVVAYDAEAWSVTKVPLPVPKAVTVLA